MRPYTLPSGYVQIAFSGGRTSAYLLHEILEANGNLPDRAVVTFQNTGREMPQTLDFVQECGERWGVRIVWLEYRATEPLFERVSHNSAARDGEPFAALVRKRRMLPNQASRFCTTELKVRTAKRYLRSLGWDYWTNAVGLRSDEPNRLKKEGVKHGDRWMIWQPLAHAGIGKHDIADFWRRQPFDLRLPNIKGNCWLGNCDGCFLKSEANVAALTRDFSESAQWWEDQENWMKAYWPNLSTFERLRRILRMEPTLAKELRDAYGKPIRSSVLKMIADNPRSADQFSKRYSRAELREYMERQGDWALSTEGALCQENDGECFG